MFVVVVSLDDVCAFYFGLVAVLFPGLVAFVDAVGAGAHLLLDLSLWPSFFGFVADFFGFVALLGVIFLPLVQEFWACRILFWACRTPWFCVFRI